MTNIGIEVTGDSICLEVNPDQNLEYLELYQGLQAEINIDVSTADHLAVFPKNA